MLRRKATAGERSREEDFSKQILRKGFIMEDEDHVESFLGARNEEEWIQEYKQRGALWIHDDNPKRPHALLTSGKHSSGFFNSELVLEDPVLLDNVASDLIDKFADFDLDPKNIDRVVGPAMGAITFAHDVARWVFEHSGKLAMRAYTEKSQLAKVRRGDAEIVIPLSKIESGDWIVAMNAKDMVFERTKIKPGERVLIVEDVLTTGGSVELSVNAVKDAGGIVLPFVAVIVNRSGLKEVDGKKIISLIDRRMPTWSSAECPLCRVGSEAIRPKGKEEWARLNAAY